MEDIGAVCRVVDLYGPERFITELGLDVHVRTVVAVLRPHSDRHISRVLASFHVETLQAVLGVIDVVSAAVLRIQYVRAPMSALLEQCFEFLNRLFRFRIRIPVRSDSSFIVLFRESLIPEVILLPLQIRTEETVLAVQKRRGEVTVRAVF